MSDLPVLYSFRRCPYAIRARMTLGAANVNYEHREVLLRSKPKELVEVSAKATVPVLVLEQQVLDESIAIMKWALARHDPWGWLAPEAEQQNRAEARVNTFEQRFKPNLDAYKYGATKTEEDRAKLTEAREHCEQILAQLSDDLQATGALQGPRPGFTDVAIFPFIRQYAAVDPKRWQAQPFESLHLWLDGWLHNPSFLNVMQKHALWVSEPAS